MLKKAGIEKKFPAQLRLTYATNLLNAGRSWFTLRRCSATTVATTQIDTNVGQERMEKVVGQL